MSNYAIGTHAYFICDRCGLRYPYLEQRKEWTNLTVCEDCYEEKHPQLELKGKKADAEGLYNPAPDRKEPLEVHAGKQTFPPLENVVSHGLGIVGEVTVETP